jgi:hypothetical protein
MLLLTDGTVMVQDDGSQASASANWWRLTPGSTMTRIGRESSPRPPLNIVNKANAENHATWGLRVKLDKAAPASKI